MYRQHAILAEEYCPLPLDLSHDQAADLRWLSSSGKGFERCGCWLASESEPFRHVVVFRADREHAGKVRGELSISFPASAGSAQFVASVDAYGSRRRRQRRSCPRSSMTASGRARLPGQFR